jgi:hypothetical protein
MNAGELVVSLLLKAGDFKAQVQSAQERLDGVQAAAVDAGRATYDAGVKGAQGLGQSADVASSLQAAFEEAVQKGREISEVTKEYQRMREELIRTGAAKERLEALDDAAKKLGVSLEDAADKGAFGFERLKSVAAQALAVIGGVSILKSSIAQYYEQAQAIEKTSDALGMSIEDWQAWQRTAAAAGVDAEELSTRFMDLGDWMQDLILHDSGPLKDATKDLGVSFTDAKGKAVSFEEGLLRLSDATSKIDRQKATSILTQIGFDEKTIPLILKGRKGIEELLKVQKAQAIYSKQDIENAKKQREAQQRLNDAWEAISALFASTVSPAITFLTNLLGDLLGWVKENKQFVIVFFTALAGVITTLMLPALSAMATAAWAAIAPFTPLIAGIGAIALVVDDLITYIKGGESALSGLWSMFGTGDEIGARFKAIWEGIKSILGGVWDALSGVAKLFNSVLTLDGKGVSKPSKRSGEASPKSMMCLSKC